MQVDSNLSRFQKANTFVFEILAFDISLSKKVMRLILIRTMF